MPRTSTVDLAAAVALMGAQVPHWKVEEVAVEASTRLLDLQTLIRQALPAVELFGDLETLDKLKLELGL